jgi:hypothetical protein
MGTEISDYGKGKLPDQDFQRLTKDSVPWTSYLTTLILNVYIYTTVGL